MSKSAILCPPRSRRGREERMKLILRMIPAMIGAGLLFAAPAHARNYNCALPGNANKAVCKTAAIAPAAAPPAAPTAKTPAARHYDCSKAGNANKTACKGEVAATPAAAPPPATAPARQTASRAPAPAPASRSAAPATTNAAGPDGATAICADGTYSHSAHRSGTCSRHGGVKSWY
jgi:hypothetical protein